jgi:hypothetical protein
MDSKNLKNLFASILERFEEAILTKPGNQDETQSENKEEDSEELVKKEPFQGTR